MALAPICTPPQHPCPCILKGTTTSRALGFGLAVTPPHKRGTETQGWGTCLGVGQAAALPRLVCSVVPHPQL